jgi:NADPH-dependent 2,4-dienoyl-CoA reductase/sulfur reductase-like enzyme
VHLLVVGASLAGLKAVEGARKAGFRGEITLVGAEPHLPYDRPPLSKAFLVDAEPGDTTYRSEASLRDELGVQLRLGAPATALDPDARKVTVDGASLGYDALVIASGASARTLPMGVGLAGVHTLRTVDDARAVRSGLDRAHQVVVIGAGFIGSEVAASARKRGLDVTVVEALPTPLVRAVGEAMGAVCAQIHPRNGTALRCGIGVASIEGDGHVERVVLSDGAVLAADLVVVGVGASPNTQWLEGSGLTIDDGVVCDETLWTGTPGIYAAGDVARWRNPLYDQVMRLEHHTSAVEQGALAARNALDPSAAAAYSTVPYFWSDQYDGKVQFVGVPGADEVRVVMGTPDELRFVALYRRGDHAVGALAVNKPAETMKFRGLLGRRPTWDEALEFAAARSALHR